MANTNEKQELLYAANIICRAVIPLLRVMAEESSGGASLLKKKGSIQFRTESDGKDLGLCFRLDGEKMKPSLELESDPDLEFFFKDLSHFVAFFKGSSKKLPKIKGIFKLGLLIPTLKLLLKMSSLMTLKNAPEAESEKILLVKLLFYLLPAGISTLNDMKHPKVREWSEKSPDRVYSWTLDGHSDAASYLRVKGGKTVSKRGMYKRSKPFFNMRFADPVSALGVLQQTEDMLKLTAEKKLIMEGAPEFGSKIGDLMMLVGSYVQDA